LRPVPTTSRRWRFDVEVWDEDKFYHPDDWAEVLRVCDQAGSGVVVAHGEAGEHVEMEFNASNASIIYADDDRVLRPYLPGRDAASQDIDEFFCNSCGLRVGDLDKFLARCMGRSEGFRLCGALITSGSLPDAVPDDGAGQAPSAVEWRDYPVPE
jgi:hypothetical protein